LSDHSGARNVPVMNHYSMELLGRDHVRTLMEEAAYRGPRRAGTTRRLVSAVVGRLVSWTHMTRPASPTGAAPITVGGTHAAPGWRDSGSATPT
jgi:hypothetical protein